ncbi:MAG: hypothetical protein WBG36_14010 [Ornithinimicrobium sp.]
MLHTILLSVAVALIMVSTIRWWGRPPQRRRVWAATAIGAAVCVTVILAGGAVSDQDPTLGFSVLAVIVMSAWLLKTGRDYTKTSRPR